MMPFIFMYVKIIEIYLICYYLREIVLFMDTYLVYIKSSHSFIQKRKIIC